MGKKHPDGVPPCWLSIGALEGDKQGDMVWSYTGFLVVLLLLLQHGGEYPDLSASQGTISSYYASSNTKLSYSHTSAWS